MKNQSADGINPLELYKKRKKIYTQTYKNCLCMQTFSPG